MWTSSKKGLVVLDEITRLRTNILERTRDINRVTEREVVAAAASTARIVGEANTHIAQMRSLLGTIGGPAQTGREPAAAAIESSHRPIARRIEAQCQTATEAARQCSDIERAARDVQGLALKAKVIALNASIQAARARGAEALGFGPIAQEMMELSESITLANRQIGQLASALSQLLPGLATEASAIQGASEDFSRSLTVRVTESEAEAARLRNEVGQMLSQGDAVMAHVIEASHESLSHLQFQDTVAQGLLRMDMWLRDAQVKTSQVLGLRAREGDFEAVAHVELGGEKAIDQVNAGEVVLF